MCITFITINKKYWIEPEKFIPERFDPSSEYFLAPNGKKRHPMAFVPFTGGKRICTGKTFAETVAKFVIPAILGKFRFTLKDNKGDKELINLDTEEDPIILVKCQRSGLF